MEKTALEKVCLELVCRDIKIENSKDYFIYSNYKGFEILKCITLDTFQKAYEKVSNDFHLAMEKDLGISMTQDELIKEFDKLKQDEALNEKEYEEAVAKSNQLDMKHRKKRSELKKLCTHKYTDGSSAYENGYAHGWCKICLAGD